MHESRALSNIEQREQHALAAGTGAVVLLPATPGRPDPAPYTFRGSGRAKWAARSQRELAKTKSRCRQVAHRVHLPDLLHSFHGFCSHFARDILGGSGHSSHPLAQVAPHRAGALQERSRA